MPCFPILIWNYLAFQSVCFERTWWRLLSVPDEGYWVYLMKVIERTWWRLLSVPDEGYWAYLMKVIERTWWKLLSVPDESYWAYLMKVIERTWWRLLSVPDESYWAYLMKVNAYLMTVIPETRHVHYIWYLRFVLLLIILCSYIVLCIMCHCILYLISINIINKKKHRYQI